MDEVTAQVPREIYTVTMEPIRSRHSCYENPELKLGE